MVVCHWALNVSGVDVVRGAGGCRSERFEMFPICSFGDASEIVVGMRVS